MYRLLASAVSLLFLAVLHPAYAASDVLQQHLEKMHSIQGTFAQEVFDNDVLIQEATGRFYLERPARLRWVTDEHEASVLVADGETIWFYNPFIEQVTLYTQADAMEANPLLLLLDSAANWDNFDITRVEEQAESNNSSLANEFWQVVDPQAYGSSLVLGFADSQLTQLIVDDGQGQKSVFHLQIEAQNEPIEAAQFSFSVGPETDVDDQRE